MAVTIATATESNVSLALFLRLVGHWSVCESVRAQASLKPRPLRLSALRSCWTGLGPVDEVWLDPGGIKASTCYSPQEKLTGLALLLASSSKLSLSLFGTTRR
ncbi:hypothetical protein WMY93_018192 [Mugilogobius chulae]|uniref:Secreted protein n=1 Tax=Mugilogobius chulae TaxID=88201 RepID=A0AAW0NJF3_9GOBI